MITYKTGSLLDQQGILAHVVNDSNRMGAGVALALSKKWPRVKQWYHHWFKTSPLFIPLSLNDCVADYDNPAKLGRIQLVQVDQNVIVCNMIGQSDPGGFMQLPPIRYQSLEECLMRLKIVSKQLQMPVHIPRIGCSLAGGSWAVVEEIINRVGLDVTVWDIDNNWNP